MFDPNVKKNILETMYRNGASFPLAPSVLVHYNHGVGAHTGVSVSE